MSTTWFFEHELCRLRQAWVDAVREHARRPDPAALERAHAAFDAYFETAERRRLDGQRSTGGIVEQRGSPAVEHRDGHPEGPAPD